VALIRRAGVGACAAFVAVACGGGTPPVATPRPAPTSIVKAVPVGGPSSDRCRLGELSDAVPRLEVEKLLSNPEPYYGEKVVLRGYFVMDHVETTALLEPKRRQGHILVSIRKLPAERAEQILACRLKLVDVQGYITHVPSRGGEAPIIFGEAMLSAAK
jgi:hypothetical protein